MTEWSAADVNARYMSDGLTLIRNHPVLFLGNQLFGLVKIVAGPGRSDLGHYVSGIPYAEVAPEATGLSGGGFTLGAADDPASRLAALYSLVYLALLCCGVARGIVATLRRDTGWAPQVFLGAVGVYLLIMAAGPESYARFRVRWYRSSRSTQGAAGTISGRRRGRGRGGRKRHGCRARRGRYCNASAQRCRWNNGTAPQRQWHSL